MPNILMDEDSQITGFIDWGGAGVADVYQDIALAIHSVKRNFGSSWTELFLAEYGFHNVDWENVEWYQLLDEFF